MTATDVIGREALRCAAGREQLLEALSQRMLRHCDVEAWRQLFLGPAYGTIRFEAAQLTLVAADAPLDSCSGEEAALLAARLGGNPEPSAGVDLVLSFRSAAAALGAALLLQRLSPRRRVRTAISTYPCTVACYEVDGTQRRLVLGEAMEQAEAALERAVPGTVLITAETYALIGERIAEYVPDGLVATELEDDRVRQASITLAPHASAPMSTFAGLGLS
ncbi:MAG TPA: hypothetical protein VF522_24300 [Ramlibacter sp.]|uniref:hypothetical protein n=1 Tax=Ramlibacter sp. TaxID=1917967 RepID=UPI002ED2B576